MAMSFNRYAGWLSILAGVAGLGYALAFVVLKNNELSAVFLTLAPLLAVAGLVAVFERVREIDSGYATLALALGAFGSLAASTHGAYDLGVVLHPASTEPLKELPFPVDPRGYGTFGLTGLSVVLLAWLATKTPALPAWVGPLGLLLGIFLVLTWLGRLIVLDATSVLVLGPALVSGILSPVFFLALGAWLLGWRRSGT
jgi:hypothetical protein